MTVRIELSWDAASWAVYCAKIGAWEWLENGRVQLEISMSEADRILCLTGMSAPGAAELVNTLELAVFEAQRRNGELEAPQNRLQEEPNGA